MSMEPSSPIVTDPELSERASRVAGVFRTLALVILVVWGVGAVFVFIGALITGGANDSFISGLFGGLFGAVLFAVYGIISWAGVTLLSLIAQYISNRS